MADRCYFWEEGPRGRLAILDWARETVAVATTVEWAEKVVAALNDADARPAQ